MPGHNHQRQRAEQNNYFLSTNSSVPAGDGDFVLTPNTTNARLGVRFIGLGQLYQAKLVTQNFSGRIFFCPSFDSDANHQYDVPTNPWPPDAGIGTRCSYSSRASFNNTKATSGTHATDLIGYPRSELGFYGGELCNGGKGTGIHRYHRIGELKNHAILSDINSSSTRVPIGHKAGINILFANGSARSGTRKDSIRSAAARQGRNGRIRLHDQLPPGPDLEQIRRRAAALLNPFQFRNLSPEAHGFAVKRACIFQQPIHVQLSS